MQVAFTEIDMKITSHRGTAHVKTVGIFGNYTFENSTFNTLIFLYINKLNELILKYKYVKPFS